MYAKIGFIYGWFNICLQPLTNFPKKLHLRCLTRFMLLVSFDTTLKTSENQRFSDVFRGYRRRPVTWNRLTGTVRKCPNTELFLVRIQSECGKIRTRNNSIFGHFSRSEVSEYTFHTVRILNTPLKWVNLVNQGKICNWSITNMSTTKFRSYFETSFSRP